VGADHPLGVCGSPSDCGILPGKPPHKERLMTHTQTAARSTSPATLRLVEADRPVVLVVDDDPDTRRRIAALMQCAGWSVRQARDGETALVLAREHVPELILLDLGLPRMSGLEVLRTLKSWTDQRTRVLVVSAYASFLHLPDLQLADGAIQKPFFSEAVLRQVNRQAWPQVPLAVALQAAYSA
jgi:CheY-like chemotaxis protein